MRTTPTRKRSGIGSELLEHLITEAKATGFTRLSLETGAAAAGPARRREDGRRPPRATWERLANGLEPGATILESESTLIGRAVSAG